MMILQMKIFVELYLESRGHYCLFIPKYHCKINPIERVRGNAKKYTRTYCNYSITGLRKTMTPALGTEKARGLERKWEML